MTVNGMEEGRVRAWILARLDRPDDAGWLYDQLRDEGGDNWVLIRADIVDWAYNVVIPVDARTMDDLQSVFRRIVERTGAKDAALLLPVVRHIPWPPQDAQGFITDAEAGAGHERAEPGRQHSSPGANAWG